jgi:hypothetical protein
LPESDFKPESDFACGDDHFRNLPVEEPSTASRPEIE